MKLIITIPLFILSFVSNAQSNDFLEKVNAHRAQQNEEKKDTLHSPLKKEDIEAFTGLSYFEPNESYAINCKFKKKLSEPFDMATSSGKIKKYRVYGTLKFKLNGKRFKLNVYQSMTLMTNPLYKDYLFVPYTDNTNGEESYIGGRYIDVKIPKYKIVELDFNLSYNPYCAYNDGYSCPIPPSENYLDTKIEAGEKVFKKH